MNANNTIDETVGMQQLRLKIKFDALETNNIKDRVLDALRQRIKDVIIHNIHELDQFRQPLLRLKAHVDDGQHAHEGHDEERSLTIVGYADFRHHNPVSLLYADTIGMPAGFNQSSHISRSAREHF